MKFKILILSLLFCGNLFANLHNKITTQSYIGQFLPMAYALTLSVISDKESIYSLAKSTAFTVGVTEITKSLVHRKRPDWSEGRRKDSFPSGHTSFAFNGAAFVHQRFGILEALPAYAVAAYVGWTRIYLKKHHPTDVLAGASLAYFSNWLLVDKKINNNTVTFIPTFFYEKDFMGASITIKF